jgi:catechol 2,3-dioxygenase-like lactoylglutathione lyase family enzyme
MGNGKSRPVWVALEAVVIPVADVDRSLRFYAGLGWRLDADIVKGDEFRLVQFTPPGSACSIQFGRGTTSATPGSEGGLYLIVSDIRAARDDLVGRGVSVSEVFHRVPGQEDLSGPDPERHSYASFVSFHDPDGNAWLVQEVTVRLPGRQNPDVTTFWSPSGLAAALRRAATAHRQHERRIGQSDVNWPDWYAEYIVREQARKPLPS